MPLMLIPGFQLLLVDDKTEYLKYRKESPALTQKYNLYEHSRLFNKESLFRI